MFQSQDGNFAHMTGTKICGIVCVSVCPDMQHLSSDWKLQELYVPFTVPHCSSISKFLNVFVSSMEGTAIKDTGTFAGGGGGGGSGV